MNKNNGLRGGKKWYLCAFNGLLWINVALCTCFLTSYPHFKGGLCTFLILDVGSLLEILGEKGEIEVEVGGFA
jgi:hypothetical protein